MERHIDGIVLQVKHETFVSLRAWLATFHLQAIEYYNAWLKVSKERICHNLGQESEVSKQLTARNWSCFAAVLYQPRYY